MNTKHALEPRYSIGHVYKTRGKSPRICSIVDIHRTFNAAGELVKLRYVATHTFMGQLIVDADVCETTVAMGS